MSQNTDAKVQEVAARYEREAKEAEERARQRLTADGQPEHEYDRWLRERKKQDAKQAQERALAQQQPQQLTPANQALWDAWADGRIKAYLDTWFGTVFTNACNPVIEDIGKVLAKDRRIRLEEDEKLVSEVENCPECQKIKSVL